MKSSVDIEKHYSQIETQLTQPPSFWEGNNSHRRSSLLSLNPDTEHLPLDQGVLYLHLSRPVFH
jgi:hypothetical protein